MERSENGRVSEGTSIFINFPSISVSPCSPCSPCGHSFAHSNNSSGKGPSDVQSSCVGTRRIWPFQSLHALKVSSSDGMDVVVVVVATNTMPATLVKLFTVLWL